MHHEGKLAHAISTYSICTSALPKTTLHNERNIKDDSFPFIEKENAQTQVHCQQLHFIMKESYHMLAFLTPQAQVHFQETNCTMKQI